MKDYLNHKEFCHLCREEETTINAEIAPGTVIYVCASCLETAKQNFIWICLHCGNIYIRPKTLVLKRLTDHGLRQAYKDCVDLQIIQGIDQCIECAPEEIVEFVAAAKGEMNSGHC